MTTSVIGLSIDCADHVALAGSWSEVLGRPGQPGHGPTERLDRRHRRRYRAAGLPQAARPQDIQEPPPPGTCAPTSRGEEPAVVILTTTGARSGSLRKTPIMRVERDGVYAAIASYARKPRNPQ
jgi:hypothetical protein